MVGASKLPGALHGQQVAGVGHHADLTGATFRLTTDLAQRIGREVEATAALPHLAACCQQGIGEAADLLFRLAKQMQGQPLGGAWSDSGEPLKLLDQAGQWTGVAAQDRAAAGRNVGGAGRRMAYRRPPSAP